ncbi:putative HSP20-like chaperone [Medicago truncatula]|uniref:Putative HSP20-like chaperone n=1 Tax=Medicago truncatula TaxID=3880 RepID=A0A396IAJ9_MEDTR|nr:putative HSP20-like chaperone [Medicago truncatula]
MKKEEVKVEIEDDMVLQISGERNENAKMDQVKAAIGEWCSHCYRATRRG